ncbi:MAG TPA: hypothetical protein VFE98_05485 [Candidatus Bathyarchaeia archaeon]|nr:hypothetical protein [Candidatus Bathyarchaeia archaeon]
MEGEHLPFGPLRYLYIGSSNIIIVLLLIVSAALLSASAAMFLNPVQSGTITKTPILNPNLELGLACNYTMSNYDSTIGLVAETPAHQKYWLYSDNYLASIALGVPCERFDVAAAINATL